MIDSMLRSFTKIDESLYEELEEILIMGDVGITTSQNITKKLREKVKETGTKDAADVRGLLKEIIAGMLSGGEELKVNTKPSVILVIGVNGVGKTTSIGKLAAIFKSQGKKVLLGAADTFRAAAIEQLEVWAGRAGVDLIKHSEGADPAAVVFDTVAAGKARGTDIIICDTAGRLHNKKNLMAELNKINRVIDRELPDADKEGTARARRHHRPECRDTGQRIQRGRGHHWNNTDKAGRYGQGRRRHSNHGEPWNTGEIYRRGRADRRSPAV